MNEDKGVMPDNTGMGSEGGGENKELANQAINLVLLGMKVINSKGTSDQIVKMLKSKDKVRGIATALLQVIALVESKAGEIPDEAKIAGGNYLLQELIDLGMKLGLFEEFTEDEKAAAAQEAVSMYTATGLKSGKYKKEDFEQEGPPTMPGSGPAQAPMESASPKGLIQQGGGA